MWKPRFTTLYSLPAILLLVSSAHAGVREAIVTIDGSCSGVCVSDSGLVLTAKHCRHPERVRVRFPDRTVSAVRLYVAPKPEGVVVFDCEGDGYPFLDVAAAAPKRGDPVTAVGYSKAAEFKQSNGVVKPSLTTYTETTAWVEV
ncbi:MAG: trypsin-like peptidase domain-containing protein, partial [Planctomycetaceae bacterium]|nr:trypsin-like peptidase domain-containing protein [Planctomycetaceae bacterium]